MKSLHIVLGVAILVAALLGAAWYGATVENKFLKEEVSKLNAQLEEVKARAESLTKQLSELQTQYVQTTKELEDKQKQLNDLQNQYKQLQQQLSSLQQTYQQVYTQYTTLQNQYNTLQSDYQQLQYKYSQLQQEYSDLENKAKTLQDYIYGGKRLVDDYMQKLKNIKIEAPNVGNSWTFVRTYESNYTLHSGYYTYWPYYLTVYDTIEVTLSDSRLEIKIFDTNQFQQYRQSGGIYSNYLAYGRGSVRFRPTQNGTYYIVIENNSPSTINFNWRDTFYTTWYYCDEVFRFTACNKPYVEGVLGTPSRDFFKLFALYNYWVNNRETLAQQVLKMYPTLTKVEAYSLSLAALLASAGFNVTFAAVSTSWKEPMKPTTVMPVVIFKSTFDPQSVFQKYFDELPTRLFHAITNSRNQLSWYGFFVLFDMYYVHEIGDLSESSFTPFNVVYVEGVTELP